MMEMSIDSSTNIHIIEFPIANFNSSILGEPETVESPISTAVNLYNTHWKLVINPRVGNEYTDYLSCYLARADEENFGPDMMRIESEFSLVGSDGSHTFKQSMAVEFNRNSCQGLPMYVKLEDIFHHRALLFPSDTLTLRCKLRLLPPKKRQTKTLTMITSVPIKNVTRNLMLDSIRSIGKKDPITLSITELLSVRVSMNKDEASAEQEEASAEQEEASAEQEEASAEQEEASAEQDVADTSKNLEAPETFLHIVIEKHRSKNPINVSCWVKLLNMKLEIVVDKKVSYTFSKLHEIEKSIFPYFIDTSNLGDDYIKNDGLCLEFDFTICDSQSLSLESFHWEYGDTPKIMTCGEELYENKKFDVTLRVGNESFSAHKCVLAFKSARFKEILKLKESPKCKNHVVEIADVDEVTMKLLLQFIYTSKLENINDERCLLLYSAARKYKIPSLHLECARYLRGCLSLEEVFNALLLAEKFCDSELKRSALYFIENDRRIFSTPQWRTLIEEHKELADQVVEHLFLKKKQQFED